METQSQITPPPEDLAGYQHIVVGPVEDGDILVGKITRAKAWAKDSIGTDVDNPICDVYRKMECPKHEGQAKFERNASGLPEGWEWKYIPDGDLRNAKTDDVNKPPLAKLPWKALRAVAGVQQYGHKKYGDFYNYKKGMEVTRQISCSMRHLADYLDGIDLDSESGQSHLAHAATRILFALENILDGTAKDDRFKP